MKFGMYVEVDEWCTMVCRLSHSLRSHVQKNSWKLDVLYLRYASGQTDRHADHTTSLTYRDEVMKSSVTCMLYYTGVLARCLAPCLGCLLSFFEQLWSPDWVEITMAGWRNQLHRFIGSEGCITYWPQVIYQHNGRRWSGSRESSCFYGPRVTVLVRCVACSARQNM